MGSNHRLCSAVLLAAACTAPAADPRPDAQFSWDVRSGESLALRWRGEELWRFHHGVDRAKPCFHPLALPGGCVLTLDQPADHRWHHGLWFSWKLIDGVNYWENDPQTGRPAGRTSWQVDAIDRRGDGSARMVLRLGYAPAAGEPALHEVRSIEVGAPGPDGAFAIDWDGTFTAARDCVLDRTPLPGEPGGQVFGGYAGLSLRLAALEARQAVTTGGVVAWNPDDRFRGRAAAMEYDGVLAGREAGVAILDHPENLNAPTPWYAIRSKAMTFFTPAVLCHGAHRLRAGEQFRLRYRIHVHPGRWDRAQLAAAAARYGPPTPR